MKVRCVKDTGDSIFKIGDICECVKINAGANIYRVSNKKGRTLCSYDTYLYDLSHPGSVTDRSESRNFP